MTDPKLLKEKINKALAHNDAAWAYHHMLDPEARGYVDILIVAENLPMAFVAGTQELRFRELHRRAHRFA